MQIPIEQIEPNPNQARKRFSGLDELAASIQERGLLEPIMVRPIGDRYQIIYGERRWRACRMAGLTEIEAVSREATDQEAYELALVENLQRADLDPIEEAEAFVGLQEAGWTQERIGNLIGKSQQYVADHLALLRLSEPVKNMITARAVSPSIGTRLARVENPKTQTRLAHRAVNDNLRVRDIEYEARKDERNLILEDFRKAQLSKFRKLAEEEPALAQLEPALRNSELLVVGWTRFTKGGGQWDCWGAEVDDLNYLQPQDFTKEMAGQYWHWPKYSGAVLLTTAGYWRSSDDTAGLTLDQWDEDFSVPMFSDEEWAELMFFTCREAMDSLEFPGSDYFEYMKQHVDLFPCAVIRREYDPTYGHFIVECPPGGEHPKYGSHPHDFSPVYIKQGWGKWCVVEFNDGCGGRERRRYFAHDFVENTLIRQAVDTTDPFAFSADNFERLNLWNLQPAEMSWWYIRRRTVSREQVIAALEADLTAIRETDPVSDDEFQARVMDWLRDCPPGSGDSEWREGVSTFPRRPDGTMDEDGARAEIERWTGRRRRGNLLVKGRGHRR